MAQSIQKKSLVVFTQNERSGLKSDNGEIIVPAEYDEIIVGCILSANSLKIAAFNQYSASSYFFGGIYYDSQSERSA